MAARIKVSEKIGEISYEWLFAKEPIANLILGHGAGAGMNHSFMQSIARHLGEQNISTLRYQFPYMEKGGKMPDRPAVAHKTIEEVIKHVYNSYPGTPLFAGGKSFGGRMTSQLMAKWKPEYIKGLVFFGFPLHAPGKPSIDRANHLFDIEAPLLFLQGRRDKLATPALLAGITSKLSKATVKNIEGADHSFNRLKSTGISQDKTIAQLASITYNWIQSLN